MAKGQLIKESVSFGAHISRELEFMTITVGKLAVQKLS